MRWRALGALAVLATACTGGSDLLLSVQDRPPIDVSGSQQPPGSQLPDGPLAGEPPPPPADARCGPGAPGPHWVLEGTPITIQARCQLPFIGGFPAFEIQNLPRGASFDAARATIRWTPGADQAATYDLTVVERVTGEQGRIRIGVVENEAAPNNVRIVNPAAYLEEYGLPVFHLTAAKLELGVYQPATIVYRGKTFDAEAKVRGASSTDFPKRSLGIKFREDQLFDEPRFGDGFRARKRIVLVTTFNDNSYLRSRLAFDLWSMMSSEHVRIRAYSAVLYVNNKYTGLYTVVDHIDKRLIGAHGIDNDSDIFKAISADANFSRTVRSGDRKESLSMGYEKKEGLPEEGQPGAFDTLESLVAFVADNEGTAFRSGYPRRLNRRDYEDWWIFNTLVLGTDSHSKNSYHVYDPATGAPWRYIPWDLDATFGQNFDTTRTSPEDRNTFTHRNELFARLLADPTIAGPMRDRYRQLLANELSLAKVQALIDRYVQETGPSARRDWQKWGSAYTSFGKIDPTGGDRTFQYWAGRNDFRSYEGEVQYVREWIRRRWTSFEVNGLP